MIVLPSARTVVSSCRYPVRLCGGRPGADAGGYGSSIEKTYEVLKDILNSETRILKDPEYTIAVAELADSSVNFVVRPWVNKEDYWPTRFDLTEKIKLRLDDANIEIPFPQHAIHMMNTGS